MFGGRVANPGLFFYIVNPANSASIIAIFCNILQFSAKSYFFVENSRLHSWKRNLESAQPGEQLY